jgi:hypothetical protein
VALAWDGFGKGLEHTATVITVTEPLPVDYGGGHASGWIPSPEEVDRFDAACKERASKVLGEVRTIAEQIGISAELLHIPNAHPATAIIETAKSRGRDLTAATARPNPSRPIANQCGDGPVGFPRHHPAVKGRPGRRRSPGRGLPRLDRLSSYRRQGLAHGRRYHRGGSVSQNGQTRKGAARSGCGAARCLHRCRPIRRAWAGMPMRSRAS